MNNGRALDVLLVEDNEADAEPALRALKKGKIANTVHDVHDGAEALDFLFREGECLYREHARNRTSFSSI